MRKLFGDPHSLWPQAPGVNPARSHQGSQVMTSSFTAVPSCCSRFGVAVLLPALAEFLFYGQPAGITVFLFAFLLAAGIALGNPTNGCCRPIFRRYLWRSMPAVSSISPR
ncbi:hypothetical protein X743_30710 [Mesorhizobium sp. LNHC252B00]|nr:hypothetical protein X743_30710 [Mesorhizobium sp. LNHC252B00]